MQKLLNSPHGESVGELIKLWRQLKRVSQMDLALDVGVSSKHLSFVETGKSRPSRNLILKISQVLNLPLRQQNAFLKAGGFAAEFGEEPFDSEKLQMVREALNRIIEKHEPYPAFVVNIGYKILMANSGFITMVKHFLSESAISKYDNVYRIVFARDGLRQYIKNWETVEHFMLARLWDEAISTQNEDLIELYEEMSQLRSNTAPVDFNIDSSTPTLSLTLEKGPLTASFFSTIATLGTPLDLTTQELRIEMLFPTDNDTKALFYQ